jgi:AhpD family alkylhydroperoxidase
MERDHVQYRRALREQARSLRAALPGAVEAFGELHGATMADGALSTRTKELIALGIAIHARCEGCVTLHVRSALHAGASREEIAEAIGVAVMMGGGPATVYGAEALEAADQLAPTVVG